MERAGALGWTPETFGAATMPELILFFRGWQRANGIDPDAEVKTTKPMSKAEAERLFDEHENRKAEK